MWNVSSDVFWREGSERRCGHVAWFVYLLLDETVTMLKGIAPVLIHTVVL